MHLFGAEHLETVCPGCRSKHHGQWKSEWWMHDHYRTIDCDCGYKITQRTDHDHSGHD